MAFALALLAVVIPRAAAQAANSGFRAAGSLPVDVQRPARGEPPATAEAPVSAGVPLPALHGHADSPVFSLDLPEHPAVERRLEVYLEREKRNLDTALARMARYRRFVDSSIRERGLPPELLALPLLESRYMARAVSRSGAAGIWQIMRNTSGALGLREDEWVDERRDFWKSTQAALRKLEGDYRLFGDWFLALAAYNCGTGCLTRLLVSSGARDFWELRERGLLKPETAEFVPAFIALTRIVSSPARFGLQGGWDTSPAWERVSLSRSVDLRLLARALGLGFETLREANAELKFPVTPPYDQGYWLKVPAGWGGRVSELLENPSSRLLEYQFHRLASGDTLYGLSRRYGVALPLLEQANAGLDPRRLPVGGIVRIPVLDSGPPPAAAGGRSLDDPLKPGDTLKVPAEEP